jgi:thiol:disulfide interchange protein DsbD
VDHGKHPSVSSKGLKLLTSKVLRKQYPSSALAPSSIGWLAGVMLALSLQFWLTFSAHAKAFESNRQLNTGQLQASVLLFSPDGVAPDHQQWIGLHLKHQLGWHTYWKNPGDTGLATHLQWTTPKGIVVGKTLWPLPKKIQIGELSNYGYEDEALLIAPLQIDSLKSIPVEGANIKLHASWLVCKNECIPQEGDFDLVVSRNQISINDSTLFQQVINDQPASISKKENQLIIGKDNLVNIQIHGIDPRFEGSSFEVFPEIPDILDAKAELNPLFKQYWNKGVWYAVMPINANRSEDPSSVAITLIPSKHVNGEKNQAWSVNLQVHGNWPKQIDSTEIEGLRQSNIVAETTPFQPSLDSIDWSITLFSAFAALLGGLILNLMPCVLPVLAIKALSFVKTTPHQRQHQRRISYFYALGVVLSFLLLGGVIFILRDMGVQMGWGFQLQSPVMLAILAGLFTLISLNLLGLFEVGSSVQNAAGKFKSNNQYLESFGSGVLAVFVASPCTAPFMGASLGTALGLPAYLGLFIFACLGLGFALPIVLIATFPKLNHLLPKPGAWMERFKVFMSFPMLATVLWLTWIFGNLNGLDAMTELLGLLLLLSCGIYLTESSINWLNPRQWPFGHLLGVMTIGASLFTCGYWLSSMQAPTPASQSAITGEGETWTPWSQSKVDEALSEGHPVFVDYTAAWCITCKLNENTTFKNKKVMSSFALKKVILFKADWTHQDPSIAASLKSYGRVGVPVYVLIDRLGKAQVFSEVIGSEEILNALENL